ncbi:hypothetical protein AU468_12380 [Alkalispirochaeta sphaeroplastigenens]|uniref:Glycosyl transferase family 1 n=1 Tax=Alkalispirochaeta sphaeroplastigenens TaxID=1187066 RepID=A0A2S4JGG8_9SPIO|nr:glycosyltransferase family 1 protein [Alkalispirochaeta sphaeroplastigenens]POQ98654.1 hypothetical protein AU468_12380 [Alkalispirochaeta sphaeroplastigenens]
MLQKPLRVVQVLGHLNRAGAETMVMNLYRKIDRTRVQFDFVIHTPERCHYEDEVESLGGRIFRVSPYRGINHLAYARQWRGFFEANREIPVMHSHVRSTASIYFKIAREYGVKTIIHSHNTSSGRGVAALAKNVLQRSITDNADLLFACSRDAGRWLFGDQALRSDTFHVIKNAIDVSSFVYNPETRHRTRAALGLQDRTVFGHIGRFHPQKNHSGLVDIFGEILKRDPRALLLLVGDGELREQTEAKVRHQGLEESVRFLGSRPDIPDLLQAMDLFLMPSLFEGFPVTLVETQAAGLPCLIAANITPAIDFVPDLIHRREIAHDPAQWAQQALEIVRGSSRRDTSAAMKESGYDISENADLLVQLYTELATTGGAG